MKRFGVLLMLTAGAALAASAVSGAPTRPTLRVVDRTPVVVRGLGFAPEERVTVVVTSGSRWTKRVTTTAGGTFVTRFAVSLGRCARYSVQAFGSSGSRARLLATRLTIDCVPGGD